MKTPAETILITGASSGIGLELAKCFAAEQSGNGEARLVLVARNAAALEALAAELRRDHKIQVTVMTADLSLPETPRRIFAELSALKISVDVLVNNAGFGLHGTFVELPLQRQMEIIQVNVAALVELTGLFLPGMIQRKRGGILNVGSVAGFIPGPYMAIYYASKAFVQSFTEALAEELAGTTGITVTSLDPGPTESNFGTVARQGKTRRIQTSKMSAQAVAAYGHRAFRRGKVIAIPGFRNRILVFLTRFSPRSAIRKGVKSFNKIEE